MKTNGTEAAVLRFLRAEAFYVALVGLIGAIGVRDIVVMMREDYVKAATLPPMERLFIFRAVLAKMATFNTRALSENMGRVLFEIGNILLLLAGVAVLLFLAYRWKAKGRLLERAHVPAPAWGLWDVVKAAALLALSVYVFHAVLVPGGRMFYTMLRPWLAEAFTRVMLIGAIAIIAREERGATLADLGVRGNIPRNILIGVIAFLAMLPLIKMIDTAQMIYFRPVPLQEALNGVFNTNSIAVIVAALGVAVAIVPVAEELFFRGFLFPALERHFGDNGAIFVGAALFAAAHMDMYMLSVMFVLGLGLGYVYSRTRSLIAPVTIHVLFNCMGMMDILTARQILRR